MTASIESIPELDSEEPNEILDAEWQTLWASGSFTHTHSFAVYRPVDTRTNRFMVEVMCWAKIWGEAGISHVYNYDSSYRDRHSSALRTKGIPDPWLSEQPNGAVMQMPISDLRRPYPQPGQLAVFHDKPIATRENQTLRAIVGLSHGEMIARPWILFGPPLPFEDWPERLRREIRPDPKSFDV